MFELVDVLCGLCTGALPLSWSRCFLEELELDLCFSFSLSLLFELELFFLELLSDGRSTYVVEPWEPCDAGYSVREDVCEAVP